MLNLINTTFPGRANSVAIPGINNNTPGGAAQSKTVREVMAGEAVTRLDGNLEDGKRSSPAAGSVSFRVGDAGVEAVGAVDAGVVDGTKDVAVDGKTIAGTEADVVDCDDVACTKVDVVDYEDVANDKNDAIGGKDAMLAETNIVKNKDVVDIKHADAKKSIESKGAAASDIVADASEDTPSTKVVTGAEENLAGTKGDVADIEKSVCDVEKNMQVANVENVPDIEKEVASINDANKEIVKSRNDAGTKKAATGTKEATADTNQYVAGSKEYTKEKLAGTAHDVPESKDNKDTAMSDGLATTEDTTTTTADESDTTSIATPADTAPTTTLPTEPVPIHKPPVIPPHSIPFSSLVALSSRPYSARVADPTDFASLWETTLVPWLRVMLEGFLGDVSVDVHAGPCPTTAAVERVILVSFAFPCAAEGNKEAAGALRHTLREGLAERVPAPFQPLRLSVHDCSGSGGVVERCHSPATSSLPSVASSSERGEGGARLWFGGQAAAYFGAPRNPNDIDRVCDPRNAVFSPRPVMGMSIGPLRIDDASTMGGYVRVGGVVYGMSAAHGFVGEVSALGVWHPGARDAEAAGVVYPTAGGMPSTSQRGTRPAAYSVGRVRMAVGPRAPRASGTFEGTNVPEDERMVEMDLCLIGPIENARNEVPVPSLETGAPIQVGDVIAIEGNTEVYTFARTSGYSLGFTSDVPGVQRFRGRWTREWTVRRYAQVQGTSGRPTRRGPRQTLREWVTGGMGVPGDSGAWLMRQSDNGVMGLIWGRNHNHGNPSERVRLTYFTPMVDILAELRENHAGGAPVSLVRGSASTSTGSASTGSSAQATQSHERHERVSRDMSRDPWSWPAREQIRAHRDARENQIYRGFDDRVPELDEVFGAQAANPPS